jgi:GTP-binding protein HflX
MAQYQAVHETLEDIEAGHIPVVTALNKSDQLQDPALAEEIAREYPQAVAISALKGKGLTELRHMIQSELYETYVPIEIYLPYQQGQLISQFHEAGQVERIEHTRGGVKIQGRIPGRLVAQFRDFEKHQEPQEQENE